MFSPTPLSSGSGVGQGTYCFLLRTGLDSCPDGELGAGRSFCCSKSWLAPHLDLLLGDVSVLHSPFFGSGKLEYYLARRRPGLEVRGADTFEPVVNLHRCYLRRAGLPALPGAPGGARRGQALLLQAPLAGRAERPCRAPVRPAAQQLLRAPSHGSIAAAARCPTQHPSNAFTRTLPIFSPVVS